MNSNSIDQTAILTGATGAIGEAIAVGLADYGFNLFVISRSSDKAQSVVSRIKEKTNNQSVSYWIADLSRQAEIKRLAADWKGPLKLLVNNAAIAPPTRHETPEGIELQFATNVLSYFWMIQYFSGFMKNQPDSRIVNVASYWAGDLEIDDLEFTSRSYHNHTAYRQSKQANRMLTPIFADRLQSEGITVNSCHPGDVNSKLSNDLGFGGSQTPAQGAATPIWISTAPELKGITGNYYEHGKQVQCQYASNRTLSQKLFDLCQGYTKDF